MVCSLLFYLNIENIVSEKHIKSFYTILETKPNSYLILIQSLYKNIKSNKKFFRLFTCPYNFGSYMEFSKWTWQSCNTYFINHKICRQVKRGRKLNMPSCTCLKIFFFLGLNWPKRSKYTTTQESEDKRRNLIQEIIFTFALL